MRFFLANPHSTPETIVSREKIKISRIQERTILDNKKDHSSSRMRKSSSRDLYLPFLKGQFIHRKAQNEQFL